MRFSENVALQDEQQGVRLDKKWQQKDPCLTTVYFQFFLFEMLEFNLPVLDLP